MDASKERGRRLLRSGPLTLLRWARRGRFLFAGLLLVSMATFLFGIWYVSSWTLPERAPVPTLTPSPSPSPSPTLTHTLTPKHKPTPTPTAVSTITTLSATEKLKALRRCVGDMVTVAVGKGAGLGDSFMGWASARALARLHKLQLATPSHLQDALLEAFRDLPMGSSLAALLRRCPSGAGLREEDALRFAYRPRSVPKAAAAFAAAVARAKANAGYVSGPLAVPVYAPYVAEYVEDLRAVVRWRPELRDGAQATLRAVANATAARFGCAPRDVVLVAVHARRDDPAWEEGQADWAAAADYYVRALRSLARMLEEVADAEAGHPGALAPLAAVVAGDDMPWVRRVLLPALDNMADSSALKMASFASGGGTEGSALSDLALLSACNHSVISYGTYGMMVALLVEGHVVAYDLNSTYPNSQFAKQLTGWMLVGKMDALDPTEENG